MQNETDLFFKPEIVRKSAISFSSLVSQKPILKFKSLSVHHNLNRSQNSQSANISTSPSPHLSSSPSPVCSPSFQTSILRRHLSQIPLKQNGRSISQIDNNTNLNLQNNNFSAQNNNSSKDNIQEKRLTSNLKVKSRERRKGIDTQLILDVVKERKETFSTFGFKAQEKTDNPLLQFTVNRMLHQGKPKGSMRVTDLWSDTNVNAFIQYSKMGGGKHLLRQIASQALKQQVQSCYAKPNRLTKKDEEGVYSFFKDQSPNDNRQSNQLKAVFQSKDAQSESALRKYFQPLPKKLNQFHQFDQELIAKYYPSDNSQQYDYVKMHSHDNSPK